VFKLGVAEILLQRTKATSVAAVYGRLVREFPEARALANAPITYVESVLRPIGLSLKRAHQLHGYGLIIATCGERSLKDWRWALANVPGLGAYGSRAIACFGFGEQLGLVDGNVARVVRRVFGVRKSDPRAAAFQYYADALARSSPGNARALNLGLLDLAAAVCAPKPRCDECPLSPFCDFANSLSRRERRGRRIR
jgi:A/G-specific adenine glycosylase